MAYSWTTPVTDRADGTAKMTYTDMNRITRNVGYLQEQIYGVASITQTNWTRNDIITKSFWESMLKSIRDMANAEDIEIPTINNSMDYENINNVESACQDVYDNLSNVGIEGFLVYGTSVVNGSNVAKVKDSDFLSASTITKWNNIL